MSASTENYDFSTLITECQDKLSYIDKKLSSMKQKKLAVCKKEKSTKHRHELCESVFKEMESIEEDLQFVKMLIPADAEAGGGSSAISVTGKIMRKVFPLKMFTEQKKKLSNEIQLKILVHSTALLENKIKALQIATNLKKKKKKEARKNTSESSSATSRLTEVSLGTQVSESMCSECDCIERVNTLRGRLITPIHSFMAIETTPRKGTHMDKKKVKEAKCGNDYVHATASSSTTTMGYNVCTVEKLIQTDISNVHLESVEKFVQTDNSLDFASSLYLPEVIELLKKATKENKKSGHNFIEKKPSVVTKASGCQNSNSASLCSRRKDRHSRDAPNSCKASNETYMNGEDIETVVKDLLSWTGNPPKDQRTRSRVVQGPSGVINLVIQHGQMPMNIPKIELIGKKYYRRMYLKRIPRFAYKYAVATTFCHMSIKLLPDSSLTSVEAPPDVYSVSEASMPPERPQITVKFKTALEENRDKKNSKTLQIDYNNLERHNSGRIVLTEFGSNSDNSTQSEILARVINYLLGTHQSGDKT